MIKALILGAIIVGGAACAPPTQIDDPWILVSEGNAVPITNDVRIDIQLSSKFGTDFQARCDHMGGRLVVRTCEDVDA